MNHWYAKGIILAASVALVAIRAPYGHRSGRVPVAKNCKGTLEVVLLTIAWISFFIPLVWIVSPAFAFADYTLRPVPLAAGALCLTLGLWLFQRSHADLGDNWSITLALRENHRLITEGLYRRIRHPMYSALLLYSAGQALAVPNYVVGPSYGAAMVLLIALRLGPEERMMREKFGSDWEDYLRRTRRLVPGIW